MNKKKILIISATATAVVLIGIGIGIYFVTKESKLDTNLIDGGRISVSVYDNGGKEIDVNASYVTLDEISPHIKSAFVNLEDKRFYQHNGIDYKRVAGAIIENLKSMSFKEGASTITQQLIKNTHLNGDKTLARKLNEAKLAAKLEKEYTKDEILEAYLNVIYFGSGIYGVENACLSYFGKSASDVNLAEAALLAGVVKNPKAYSPLLNYNDSIKRQEVVLKVMLDNGAISENEYFQAKSSKIIIKNNIIKNNFAESYLLNAYDEAAEILNISIDELLRSGYKIYTYMDSKLQKTASDKVNSQLTNHDNAEAILLSIDNKTRGVTSYCSTINKADRNISRQAGSTLKPFSVYMPALELNYISPATQILDERINIGEYAPKNYNDVYHGYVSVRDSVAHSYNIPAVKILSELSVHSVLPYLDKLNIKVKQEERNLSLALGSASVSPLNLAGAYACLANYGEYSKPTFIREIRKENGEMLYKNPQMSNRVFNKDNSYIMTDMLRTTVSEGTAEKLKYLDYDIAAKTGTVAVNSDGNTDAWCAAYSSDSTCLGWIGAKDKNNPTDNSVTGGSYPTMMVKGLLGIMNKPAEFLKPEGVIQVEIDEDILRTEHRIVEKIGGQPELFTAFTAPERSGKSNAADSEAAITAKSEKGQVTFYISAKANDIITIERKKGIFGKYEKIAEIISAGESQIYQDKPALKARYSYKVKVNGTDYPEVWLYKVK